MTTTDTGHKPIALRVFLSLVRLMRSVPFLHRTIWSVRRRYHATRRAFLVGRPVVSADSFLKSAISGKAPYAAGKVGSIEAAGLHAYMARAKAILKKSRVPAYSPYISQTLHVNAGVFPQTSEAYDRFGKFFLSVLSECDLLVAWDVKGEADIIANYCPDATLVNLYTLEPFFASNPWTSTLGGRRVLVISPFIESIKRQYARREGLWDNEHVLPPFELLTLRAPLSAALVTPQDADWFAALERMQRQMDALDYDVALIGAGAFSIPLAVHAKRGGKVGVHLGGALQMLFGIYGSRWEKKSLFKPFIKSNWVRPGREETPAQSAKVEDSCYW